MIYILKSEWEFVRQKEEGEERSSKQKDQRISSMARKPHQKINVLLERKEVQMVFMVAHGTLERWAQQIVRAAQCLFKKFYLFLKDCAND